MNMINLRIDYSRWAIGACYRMDAIPIANKKMLREEFALMSAIRHPRPRRRAEMEEECRITPEEMEKHKELWSKIISNLRRADE